MTGAVRGQDFAILQGLLTVATLVWVVRIWVNPGHRFLWPPACWAVLAFAVYGVVRYFQADVEYEARLEVERVLLYGWLFFIVLNNLHRQETTQVLFVALLGLATLISMYAIYQYLTHAKTVWHFPKPLQYTGRGSGTFICPNHLAGFLEMLLPVALAGLFLNRSRATAKVFYGYAAVVILVGIGVTVSRGGWLATAIALVVLFGFLLRQRGYRLAVAISAVAIAIAIVLSLKHAENVQTRFRLALKPGQLQDIRTRPHLWGAAFRMWRDHPWVGVGPGHFDIRFPAYRPLSIQSRPFWVHNDYLNLLVDWGLVGGAIVGVFLVSLAVGVVQTLRYVGRTGDDLGVRRSDRAAGVVGMGVAILTLVMHSVVDFNMQIPANAFLAVALMASLTSHLRFSTDRYWVSPRWYGRVALTLVALPCVVVLGKQAAIRYREAVLLTAARSAPSEQVQVESYLAAQRVEPRNAETQATLGEIFRLRSWEGGDNWRRELEEAERWFKGAMSQNAFDTYPVSRYGMCLDWRQAHKEAEVEFDRAVRMDPNNFYLAMLRGWHEIQKGDYAAAKRCLERSLEIKWYDNPLANNYLAFVNARLAGAGGAH
jgi:O-antigen ligase